MAKLNLNSRTYKRALKKQMRTSSTIEEAKQKVYEQYAADHLECLASVYRLAEKQLEPKVKAVLNFFLGGGAKEWAALGEEERRRPWYYSAFRCHQMNLDFVKDGSHGMEKLATASKWAVKVNKCRCCGRKHVFNIQLGVAMLLGAGRMTREEWKAWANSGGSKGTRSQDVSLTCQMCLEVLSLLQVSHLNGISGDMNPLNLTTESSSRNLSRNECFGLLSLGADPGQKNCHKHANQAPCNFEAARMCGNWEEVVKKMVELGRNGVPAIRAYDTVKNWKSKHTSKIAGRD